MDVTAALRQLVTRRLARTERVLNESALSAKVVLTKEKYRHMAEIVIHTRGDHLLRGVAEGDGWPVSLRQAAEKIEQQAQKLKGQWNGRRRKAGDVRVARPAATEPAPGRRIVRATRYAVKPMSVEDAALRMDGGSETFIVFRNAGTDAISILYRRKDGNLGLIEPD